MKKVGRYVILSELGRGAMGVVYKASDPTIDREVALKVLSLSSANEEGTNSPQEMFMREVRAAGRLAHPSIVTIYDAFDDPVNQTSCIVMELVPGVTLEKILESGKPPTTEHSLDLIRQVAEALDYAHRNKVIHRDLKPANILVTDDGRAKITDFGIAKVLAREGVARTIGIMGTPSYMSPEQVRGGEIDARTDIFSLGIMIFTMLTGQKPFSGNTAAVMFKIVYEEPAAPSVVNTNLTPAFDFVVKKCLAKDRANRYSSVRELLGDVDDLQHGRPPRSQTEAPQVAEPAPPSATPPEDQTIGHAPASPGTVGAKPQPPRMPPPATPLRPEPSKAAPPPVATKSSHSATEPTVAMPNRGSQPPLPRPPLPHPVAAPPAAPHAPAPPVQPPPIPASDAPPLMGKTLVMRVPDLAAVSSQPQTPPTRTTVPPAAPDAPLMGRTLPMRVPDLSGVPASGLPAAPKPPAVTPPLPPVAPRVEQAQPVQQHEPPAVHPPPPAAPQKIAPPLPLPDFSAPVKPASPAPPAVTAPPPVARATVSTPAPPPQHETATDTVHFDDVPVEAAHASKSKVLPIVVGIAALLFVAVAGLGFWMFHRSRTTTSAPQTVQTQPVTPPPVSPPVVTPPPAPEVPAQQPAAPVTPPTQVTKKPVVKKTKATVAPHPEPAPAPAPVVVTPPPAPEPAGPTPAEIARAEAAKLASAPRIINVICNFSLKEATFTFSGGGKTIYQETEKGKKKKGGFLGIKGSYEGTFTHTLTIPAGVTQLSLHVESKDGSTDVSNAVKMPGGAGFVPTLNVQVDNDHLTLVWKSSATP